ncbi:MAG: DNA alkylation repair protein [Actinomycetota bacterium]
MAISPSNVVDELRAQGDPVRAAGAAAYHKTDRPFLGVPNPVLDGLAERLRRKLDADEQVALAGGLWRTDIHEARIGAAKLLTQARIRPDDTAAWELIAGWRHDFDSWAIADHACMAGQRRLVADPHRIDEVEPWTASDHLWTKRAALVITLPWTKQRDPDPDEVATRERILSWAAGYVADREWFIQKAIAWWVRELSKRDPERAGAFLAEHGDGMKAFARKEAGKYLG